MILAVLLMFSFSTTPLFAQSAQSANDELPRIAVYVTGNVSENEKNALGTQMLVALINSRRYRGIERASAFRAEIERELQTQHSGMIDDDQISALGRQFGVRYICIADITPAFGTYQVSARIINVETAEVVSIGAAHGRVQSMDELVMISNDVVRSMFGVAADNFTVDQRFVSWGLNVLIPGLGSRIIMNDKVGGWTLFIVGGTGYAMVFGSISDGAADNATTIGGIIAVASVIFNTYRTITYDKPAPRMAFGENHRFDFAIFPNQNGNLTAFAGLRLEF